MNEQPQIRAPAAAPRPQTALTRPRPRWRRRAVLFLIVLIVAGGAVAAYYYYPRQQAGSDRVIGRRGDDGPVPVLVAKPRHADVPIYLDCVGTVRALNTVTVRPQVDGQLISVGFGEGQDVKKGDILAKVDPRTYQAQLDQATAKKAQDEAQLANARVDLDRYTKLAITASVTRQQADTQKAAVAQLEAQVNADQAMIDNARTYLGWTEIRAPIEGRTGIRTVDEGNIVHASDPTGIVVLTQLRPISVIFNIPQQQLPGVVGGQSQGPLPVEALGPDGKTVADRGKLMVIDNQVDPTTGTLRLKAEFPNQDLRLWPGAFANIKLLIDTMRDVMIVPTAAVQRGPTGAFVYVVQPGDKVAVRPINITYQDEAQTVVSSGIDDGETVVTTGFAQLADGKEVRVSAPPGAPAAADAQGPRKGAGGGRRERGQSGKQPPAASPGP